MGARLQAIARPGRSGAGPPGIGRSAASPVSADILGNAAVGDVLCGALATARAPPRAIVASRRCAEPPTAWPRMTYRFESHWSPDGLQVRDRQTGEIRTVGPGEPGGEAERVTVEASPLPPPWSVDALGGPSGRLAGSLEALPAGLQRLAGWLLAPDPGLWSAAARRRAVGTTALALVGLFALVVAPLLLRRGRCWSRTCMGRRSAGSGTPPRRRRRGPRRPRTGPLRLARARGVGVRLGGRGLAVRARAPGAGLDGGLGPGPSVDPRRERAGGAGPGRRGGARGRGSSWPAR